MRMSPNPVFHEVGSDCKVGSTSGNEQVVGIATRERTTARADARSTYVNPGIPFREVVDVSTFHLHDSD